MVQIVSALDAAGAGNRALEALDEGAGLLHQLDGTLAADGVAGDKVEPGAAAHRADIEDAVGLRCVADIGGKQMLEGVDAVVFQIDAGIGGHHSNIVGDSVAVDAGEVHPRSEGVMVDAEALNSFHRRLPLSCVAEHLHDDASGVTGSGFFKVGGRFGCFLVRIVAHGADDDKWDVVDTAGVANGSAFHLDAHRVVFLHDSIFDLGGFDELVAGGNLADKAAGGAVVNLLEGLDCRFHHQLAGKDAVNVRWIVAQEACVVVVVAQLAGDDNIQNLQVVMDSTCDAGIDDAVNSKAVNHHLGGDGGVDLADAAATDDCLLTAEDAFPEYLTTYIDFADILHLLF